MWRKTLILNIIIVSALSINANTTNSLLFEPDSIGEILHHTKKIDGLDSLVNIVIDHKPTHLEDERVIVGKDTINVILPGKNYSRYDRGLLNFLFIPRGQWIIGATASFSEFNTEDIRLL